MNPEWKCLRSALLAGLVMAAFVLAVASGAGAQATSSTAGSDTTAAGNAQSGAQSAQQPAPGTTPVGGDIPAPPAADSKADSKPDAKGGAKPAPGTTPVGGDDANVKVDADKVIDPGSEMIKIKPGSEEDVSAVGNREKGKRGVGNWYSTDSEIKMGKQYADEVEKSARFITDPTVEEYVNRVGQNIVKNSDCKVPFTIKVIDSDEINAFALPGGFFYVNSGLILAADEEAEQLRPAEHHSADDHARRHVDRIRHL